jgi:hypothetical protein
MIRRKMNEDDKSEAAVWRDVFQKCLECSEPTADASIQTTVGCGCDDGSGFMNQTAHDIPFLLWREVLAAGVGAITK